MSGTTAQLGVGLVGLESGGRVRLSPARSPPPVCAGGLRLGCSATRACSTSSGVCAALGAGSRRCLGGAVTTAACGSWGAGFLAGEGVIGSIPARVVWSALSGGVGVAAAVAARGTGACAASALKALVLTCHDTLGPVAERAEENRVPQLGKQPLPMEA